MNELNINDFFGYRENSHLNELKIEISEKDIFLKIFEDQIKYNPYIHQLSSDYLEYDVTFKNETYYDFTTTKYFKVKDIISLKYNQQLFKFIDIENGKDMRVRYFVYPDQLKTFFNNYRFYTFINDNPVFIKR